VDIPRENEKIFTIIIEQGVRLIVKEKNCTTNNGRKCCL
jgi:hypothetical protein